MKQLTFSFSWKGEQNRQAKSYWQVRGRSIELCAISIPDTDIYNLLGAVKQKNDGRWEWFLNLTGSNSTQYTTRPDIETKRQGVCKTLEEAKLALEKVWGINDS